MAALSTEQSQLQLIFQEHPEALVEFRNILKNEFVPYIQSLDHSKLATDKQYLENCVSTFLENQDKKLDAEIAKLDEKIANIDKHIQVLTNSAVRHV